MSREKKPKYTIICQLCGKSYLSKFIETKFCSDVCRSTNYNKTVRKTKQQKELNDAKV